MVHNIVEPAISYLSYYHHRPTNVLCLPVRISAQLNCQIGLLVSCWVSRTAFPSVRSMLLYYAFRSIPATPLCITCRSPCITNRTCFTQTCFTKFELDCSYGPVRVAYHLFTVEQSNSYHAYVNIFDIV